MSIYIAHRRKNNASNAHLFLLWAKYYKNQLTLGKVTTEIKKMCSFLTCSVLCTVWWAEVVTKLLYALLSFFMLVFDWNCDVICRCAVLFLFVVCIYVHRLWFYS